MSVAAGKDCVATEHIQDAQLAEHAIAKWQAMYWRKSKDCHHVILMVLSLRANANCQGLQLGGILLRHLPQLFTPNMEDAFFAMLEEETMTDANLCDSVVDFFTKWPHRRLASYQELLADSTVERGMIVFLPEAVPLRRWITRRLTGDIYMTEEETGSWTIHLVGHSGIRKSIAKRYREINATQQ